MGPKRNRTEIDGPSNAAVRLGETTGCSVWYSTPPTHTRGHGYTNTGRRGDSTQSRVEKLTQETRQTAARFTAEAVSVGCMQLPKQAAKRRESSEGVHANAGGRGGAPADRVADGWMDGCVADADSVTGSRVMQQKDATRISFPRVAPNWPLSWTMWFEAAAERESRDARM